jgi:ABC-type tungstate transport system permease subunit
MMRHRLFALALLASAAIGLLAGCARTNRGELVLVTTTSVGNSRLLDALLPVYEQTAGVRFGVHLAGAAAPLPC